MDGELSLNPKLLWQPSYPEHSALEQFRLECNQKFSLSLANYRDLYQWSCNHLEDFWSTVWERTGIIASQPYTEVLETAKSMDAIPKWFLGARLNFAQNLLRFSDDHIALIATGESGKVKRWTYRQLNEYVTQCANALRKVGVQKGDRVAAYIPNCAEAIVAMLAAASIGAIWSSTSPDFGTTGVLDRFTQIAPKVLFSVNAVVYNEKVHDHIAKLAPVVDALPSLQKVVVIPFVEEHPYDLGKIKNSVSWGDFLVQEPTSGLEFEQLPFDHPLYILYSSGTTGKPKCIVHSAGGSLIQHLKEHVIHGGMSRSDVFFQYTTTGWMMWNWLVSGLATGCSLLLFDGSPFKPTGWVFWDLAEKEGITKFGTSAKYIQSMQEMSIHPIEKYSLPKLTQIYSTGSPLRPESFAFVYDKIKKDVCLGSITGGTDILSLFAGHNPAIPVYEGEIQCRCLGMAVESWNEDGKPVEGQSGDLVCVKPFPCMPVYFWNDDGNMKYREAYFDKFPGVWYHGDFVWINPNTKGVVMLGRSDGTLKPAGVRFGSAELYNIGNLESVWLRRTLVVQKFSSEVADSLAVGQRRPQDDDERVVLFLKMQEGISFSKELADRIKAQIRKELSPRHVPFFVLPIVDIPYTVNGKKVEVAVKKIVSGQTVIPSGTLANPESLELYKNISDLQ